MTSGMSLEDLQKNEYFGGGKGRREQVTWLPEPEPRERVVHGDLGRRPRRRAARRVRRPLPEEVRRQEPRVVADRRRRRSVGLERRDAPERRLQRGRRAAVERVRLRADALRRDAPRRVGRRTRASPTWTSTACAASLCFPSFLPGFVGQRLTMWPDDDELALVAMRAYNDWHLEAWCGAHPDRFIPNQIAYLRDPQRRGRGDPRATRRAGFKAVTFSEAPDKLGLPTIHSGYWDPLFAACEETEHRGVPARRLVGNLADDVARRAARDPRGAVRRVRHVQRGRLAVLEGAGAVPRHQDLPLRRRNRLGGRESSTASTTVTATSSATCRRGATSTRRRARCCGATSGSARSTTTRACSCAT